MRGLKLYLAHPGSDTDVASFTDAWIETLVDQYYQREREVASFTDAWIETRGWMIPKK